MNALNKFLAALLFATLSTPALAAVTDNQVFAYAEANYATLFAGASQSGQFQQYNYRYYPATQNYLAVDTTKTIYILGPASNGNIQPVGPVSAFEGLITAWEAKQPAASGTTGATVGTAAQFFTKIAVGNTWTFVTTTNATVTIPGQAAQTSSNTDRQVTSITASSGGVVTSSVTSTVNTTTNGVASAPTTKSWTATTQLDATGALVTTNSNTSIQSATLPATLTLGKSWVLIPPSASTGKIVAFNVTRTVPAGTFTDCLQLEITVNAGAQPTIMNVYFSPTVGGPVEVTGSVSQTSGGATISGTVLGQLQAGYIAK